MKICGAKYSNHPILGNLELNFRKDDGSPYSTVVLAGENGTGKTSILDSLYSFCNFEVSRTLREVVLKGDNYEIYIESTFYANNSARGFKAKFPDGKMEEWNCARPTYSHQIGNYPKDPRNDGVAYSGAQSIYSVGDISSISAKGLDSLDLKNIHKEYSPQELKQLLVDVSAQDNADYAHRGEAHPDDENKFSGFEPNARLSRFRRAFNSFFSNSLRFDSVKIVNGKHEVLFKKNDNDIPIGNLSTGESQIVFRGGSLLKDIGNLNKGIVFIDEPEISLHPQWQKRILSYYRSIFSKDGSQNAQLIIATHSEGVLEEALKDPDTLIVILRQQPDGSISQGSVEKPSALNFSCASEINYQAFNTASTDYHNALYGYIEAEGWLNDYKIGKPVVPYIREVTDRITRSVSTITEQKILSEKIRHIIHHPENRNNNYTPAELVQSIEEMRQFILSHP